MDLGGGGGGGVFQIPAVTIVVLSKTQIPKGIEIEIEVGTEQHRAWFVPIGRWAMESVNDLIQEAKLRTLWWALCIFVVSYFLTRKYFFSFD